jgi:predicted Zn-dependent protease
MRAGYDPRALARMFETIAAQARSSGDGGPPQWLSSHPDPGKDDLHHQGSRTTQGGRRRRYQRFRADQDRVRLFAAGKIDERSGEGKRGRRWGATVSRNTRATHSAAVGAVSNHQRWQDLSGVRAGELDEAFLEQLDTRRPGEWVRRSERGSVVPSG